MKLRTRLFLWIGIIFFVTFGVSLFFETYTTDKSLTESEENLRAQILQINEEKREHIEGFLHISLSEDQAEVDSLLLRLRRDPQLGATLFLNPKDPKLSIPAHAAFLYKNDQWIDLIQSTKGGELTALLIPIDFPMEVAREVPVGEEISWVVMDSDRKIQDPFIGVKLTPRKANVKNIPELVEDLVEVDWGLLALFTPDSLKPISSEKEAALLKSSLHNSVDFPLFLKSYNHAADYITNMGNRSPREEILAKGKGTLFNSKPRDDGVNCLEKQGEVLNTRIVQLLQRDDQAIMIAALAGLFPGGAFGESPLAPSAPKGIARFPDGAQAGHLLKTNEIFFDQKIFSDAAYQKAHPAAKDCEGIGSSVAIIEAPEMDRIFVGNALHIKDPNNPSTESGYLTIGIDAELLVEDLSLAVTEAAFLVHNGRVISAYDAKGEKIADPQKAIAFTHEMLDSKSGLLKWRGEEYYYLHMVPFHDLDLHFYVLQLESKAFSLVRTVKEGTRSAIRNVSINMRIIAVIALFFVLILLQRVAKRITKPITALARVTKDVASGRLEGIELPSMPPGRHDEISTLCTSFEKMVTGLKEKEKVKGVLNKVVSPEIAEEIMKGSIHLGGEERRVSVLFADIRQFTQMTANLAPAEVIEMLNTCMTKISHVIDEYGGVIDKYVGDEVMALFGAPIEKEDSALRAVLCGLAIQKELHAWNAEREKEGKPPVEMGVGIHTGIVLAGNMGAENRLNYTVIGNNVNLAARLCGMAERGEVLISKDVLDRPHVRENIEVKELPPKEIKGYEEAFILYSVQGGKDVR
ncbi:MAG: Adenylate cyclase 2 [Chlamydiae bacterium]|nr:Adenylate cyclase 2 [Chlamydiota bacterium]